ncbi:hypothetical protein [Nostoc sp. LPT]|uniref:hypothetical protein n=1 Tax=Nostoc sp. LPT TaxID=2815387 RepID=UPI001DD55C62|nr:hypothetical protein [Nostoc sp. LPT]MBN4000967.1 hypothetical protein [Nostoc sp. LPT]
MQASSTLFENYTTDIYVVRRDGSTTPLEINKIRTVVNWACCGLSVNSIALEAHLHQCPLLRNEACILLLRVVNGARDI